MPNQAVIPNPVKAGLYAQKIYRLGTARFTSREDWSGLVVPIEYVNLIELYAVLKYSPEQVDSAFTKGWISAEEYDRFLVLKSVDENVIEEDPGGAK